MSGMIAPKLPETSLDIKSCLCTLGCGCCSDADLRNCLVSNIASLQDISKCFGFKFTRCLEEELSAVAVKSKVRKIDEWNDHLKTATSLLNTGRVCVAKEE